eukprot:gb/GEZN01005132.1/.p1 GENE.gb/GEZN01005132.1/~~gb/GEZN01005132.1/.p1  ORF type:complete len:443 (+),score=103.46 gb/GEZN01005132.1/:100-1428(+)
MEMSVEAPTEIKIELSRAGMETEDMNPSVMSSSESSSNRSNSAEVSPSKRLMLAPKGSNNAHKAPLTLGMKGRADNTVTMRREVQKQQEAELIGDDINRWVARLDLKGMKKGKPFLEHDLRSGYLLAQIMDHIVSLPGVPRGDETKAYYDKHIALADEMDPTSAFARENIGVFCKCCLLLGVLPLEISDIRQPPLKHATKMKVVFCLMALAKIGAQYGMVQQPDMIVGELEAERVRASKAVQSSLTSTPTKGHRRIGSRDASRADEVKEEKEQNDGAGGGQKISDAIAALSALQVEGGVADREEEEEEEERPERGLPTGPEPSPDSVANVNQRHSQATISDEDYPPKPARSSEEKSDLEAKVTQLQDQVSKTDAHYVAMEAKLMAEIAALKNAKQEALLEPEEKNKSWWSFDWLMCKSTQSSSDVGGQSPNNTDFVALDEQG